MTRVDGSSSSFSRWVTNKITSRKKTSSLGKNKKTVERSSNKSPKQLVIDELRSKLNDPSFTKGTKHDWSADTESEKTEQVGEKTLSLPHNLSLKEKIENLEYLAKSFSGHKLQLDADGRVTPSKTRFLKRGNQQKKSQEIESYFQALIKCSAEIPQDDKEGLSRILVHAFTTFMKSERAQKTISTHPELTAPFLHTATLLSKQVKSDADFETIFTLLNNFSTDAAKTAQQLLLSYVQAKFPTIRTVSELAKFRKFACDIAKKNSDPSFLKQLIREFSKLREGPVSLESTYPKDSAEKMKQILQKNLKNPDTVKWTETVEGKECSFKIRKKEDGQPRTFEIVSHLGIGGAKELTKKAGGTIESDAEKIHVLIDHIYAKGKGKGGWNDVVKEESDNLELCQEFGIPNIVHLQSYSTNKKGEFSLKLNLYDGDADTLRNIPQNKATITERLVIFKDTAEALSSMHEHNLCHSDIRAGNIFLDNGRGKLGDFDTMGKFGTKRLGGTDPYLDFEDRIGRPPLSADADVFAMALTLFEFMGGENPFINERPEGKPEKNPTEASWRAQETLFKEQCSTLKTTLSPIMGAKKAEKLFDLILAGIAPRGTRISAKDLFTGVTEILNEPPESHQ